MPLLFANPWGLLALLGIPVVLAIHFLHRHRTAIPVSTLFLIEIAREPARSGRRWHRLLPSPPMWLQLLLVLLLAALLSRPYLPQGVLQVAIVLDDSASMRAFRAELANHLTDLNRTTRAGRTSTQWLVLPANPNRPRLYTGDNPADGIATLTTWSPSGSWHDPESALRLARDRVGPDGLVVYATDTPLADLPSGAALLSVGHPIENAGIGGITVTESEDDGIRWEAVLVNPSIEPTERQWTLEWDNRETTAAQTITLPANGMATLGGTLPQNATRLMLRLSSDEFALDDAFPFVRPAPKPLTMATLGEGIPAWLPERMLRSIPRLSAAPAATADFALIALTENTTPPPVAGVVFSSAGTPSASFLSDTVVPTAHPLVQGLAWAGLAVQNVPAPPPAPGDEVLLWAGDRPLASLRTSASAGANPQLILHFNPALSNLERIPASAILLLRFAESLRTTKSATAWKQLEPGQSLTPFLPEATNGQLILETLTPDGTTSATQPITAATRTPDEPGFIRIRDDQMILIEAASAFADARESDFRHKARADTTADAIARAARVSAPNDDFMRTLIILASLAALLVLYHLSAAPPRAEPSPTA